MSVESEICDVLKSGNLTFEQIGERVTCSKKELVEGLNNLMLSRAIVADKRPVYLRNSAPIFVTVYGL